MMLRNKHANSTHVNLNKNSPFKGISSFDLMRPGKQKPSSFVRRKANQKRRAIFKTVRKDFRRVLSLSPIRA